MNKLTLPLAAFASLTALSPAQTWTRQSPGPTRVSLEVVDFVTASTGWVAGGTAGTGGIWRTDDGGQTWQVQLENVGPEQVDILDLQMLDVDNGWAVGDASMGSFTGVAIYHTTDGGANWLEATLPSPPTGVSPVAATRVRFVSATEGFVSTRPSFGISYLYRTTDGGSSWQYLREVALDSWYFVDADVGWAASTSQTFVRTDDGGITWSPVAQPVAGSLDSRVSRVFSYDDAVVRTLSGSSFQVHRTTNGGQSWATATGQAFAEQFFLDATRGWAINKGISKTVDGGATWTTLVADGELPEVPWHLSIVDAQTLYVSGDFGWLLRSTDGGATWQQVSAGSGQDLTAVRFVDHDIGWAVGDGFTALRTEDGGQTWRHQNTGLNAFTTASSPSRLWAFSAQSAIVQLGWFGLTHSGFASTDDGGLTWTKQTSWPLGQGYFRSRLEGWLVSETGATMWTTVDGGNTWVMQPTGLSYTYPRFTTDVFFVDAQHGWIAAYGYRVFRTTDGGQSWTTITPQGAISGAYRRIAFADPDHGWLVADHGMILRSEDGGTTWIDQTIPNSIGEPLLDLVVMGPDEAYVCGLDKWNGFGSLLGGFVRHTVDGGASWPYEVSELHSDHVAAVAVVGGDLWTAGGGGEIHHSPGVRGVVTPFGSGCAGSNNQVPTLTVDEEPIVGRTVTTRIGGAASASVGMIGYGFSNTGWGAAALPLSLAPLGAGPSCMALVSADVPVVIVTDGAGSAASSFVLPRGPGLLGLSYFEQALVFDAALPLPLPLVVSGGLQVDVGGR